MQLQIANTVEPDNPITDFNSWYQHIVLQQNQEGELRQYKHDIEASFEMLHDSITSTNFKRQ